MNISITLGDPSAKASGIGTIKAGGGVPITATFDTTPGVGAALELTLTTASSSPMVLAYLGSFAEQDSTTYTGVLDASDTRLMTAIAGSGGFTVNAELRWTVGAAEPVICPNFTLSVQPPALSGPETSDGGPVYFTQAQAQTMFNAIQAMLYGYAPFGQADQENNNNYTLVFVNGLPTGKPVASGASMAGFLPLTQVDQVNGLTYTLGFENSMPVGIPQ